MKLVSPLLIGAVGCLAVANTPAGEVRTFEVPYALVRDTPVTAESAHAFGRDIARALHMYLSAFSKTPSP